MLLRGLDESVSYFMRLVSYSMKLVRKYLVTAIRGCGRLGTRVDLQLESIKTFDLPSLQPALIFNSVDTLCNMMYTAYHKRLICVICNSYGHAWVTNSSVC